MKLHTLLTALPFVKVPEANPEIEGIYQDNRKVTKGSLFICIKGLTVDGHKFASEAVKKGAAAIISEKELDVDVPVIVVRDTKRAMAVLADAYYQHPTKKLRMVGITGTNGKTTTSHLIDQIFQDAGEKTGLIGTMYIKIDEEKIETKNTTPDSLTLQQTFGKMVNNGVASAVMEVSSHALDQGRVYGIDFDIAVFTNLTQDHLDYHHTMEEYLYAKSLLFSQLGNTYEAAKPRFAVINNDDPASLKLQKVTAAHVLTYGIDHESDFQAKDIKMSADGTVFTLISPEGEFPVILQLIGKFSVYNVLAAITAGYAARIPLESIIQSLESIPGVPGRFELVKGGQSYPVIVDYAHTPDSLQNVLQTVRQIASKRIIVVVGCGGDRDRTKRPIMAQIAVKLATDAIFTSDNPRTEDPMEILREMETGVKGEEYTVIPDRKEAIKHAVQMASDGDVIIIAGKGHETYQIIGQTIHDFDDRLVALQAIKERKNA
ncbi:UDP-N-acetylmuramoyl-L-alanyl-D-glutamate--2,6-diaminopimelate ligase [Heyndrickxia acidicola]|uniref:UDP-N-acetylmuramoyl-L-alanyl-D-glutamate--2,6-diaminopimelate ligase n=1 Tax=Heyndrickxia acidicola TaxID=209389 RepID=A0ABU6MEQ3_9BACI|nr:UDP-N-acetylmuramoyl-L-alanyl-D-glutamate--2,6-diaminopimelate ligase [Heyndrickxia acidicola]MED1202168.1 UDP-N-acetylmuramoyl-L-alanyl-D-glutamate--2,6-diaminopimelate ligase [Heyndrickxia acidicola]